eukprot:GEZU01022998.1.p1 GENE.GEZU01022998.1~~GEZU01022998.1.p1  ORF type:complete len:237 (+),score=90.75 GEZU01022998.1:163-873(+)
MDSLSPAVIKRIARELQELSKSQLEGITVIMQQDLSVIYADIEGPVGTPFEGGVFRMKLEFGADFPHQPPKGYFITKIFHPNVSKTGEICVNTLKKDWNQNLGIKHILMVVRCLLIAPNPESALNEEAGRQLLEDYDGYAKYAKLFTSIHAKPKTATTAATANAENDSSSSKENNLNTTNVAANINNDVAAAAASKGADSAGLVSPKKRVSSVATGSGTSAAAAKQADKKRSLKRL